MAGSVVSTLPIVVAFLVFQRRLVSGIMAGTVKG
jgi:ABC-type glycerol-3-phosphate transport system permease component